MGRFLALRHATFVHQRPYGRGYRAGQKEIEPLFLFINYGKA